MTDTLRDRLAAILERAAAEAELSGDSEQTWEREADAAIAFIAKWALEQEHVERATYGGFLPAYAKHEHNQQIIRNAIAALFESTTI